MRTSRTLRALVPLAAAGLVLSACGSGSTPSSAPTTPMSVAGSPTTMKPKGPTTWPLTGLPAPHGASLTKHPVYIAKVDNTYLSDPQYGFSQADMVTEELVEGGITRLAAFFYSHLPEKAGPIRSMRLTDIALAKPIDARLVTSGAAPVTIHGLQQAGVNYIAMGNPNVKRVLDGTHDELHSVVADIAALGKEALIKKPTRPHDFFQFGSGLPKGAPARTIAARFSSARTDDFTYSGGKYTLTNNYFAKGDAFTPDTVIVCYVHTTLAPYVDPAGNPVPVTHLEGSEKALIFHDGRVVKATWHKGGPATFLHFTAGGKTLKIPAGHTWMELIPLGGPSVGTGSVTWTK